MQNMGEHQIGKMVKELAKCLRKDPSNYAAKSLRGPGAAQLAEQGVSVACLQMAGNWKDPKAPTERTEHSNRAFRECVDMLDGDEAKERTIDAPVAKKTKHITESPGAGVAQTHRTAINIIRSTAVSAGESAQAALKEEDMGVEVIRHLV